MFPRDFANAYYQEGQLLFIFSGNLFVKLNPAPSCLFGRKSTVDTVNFWSVCPESCCRYTILVRTFIS